MDKEFIKEIISTEDGTSDKLIKDGDFIDSELLEILSGACKKNLQKAFYSYKGSMPNRGYKYLVELKCPDCGIFHKKSVSKTKLMQILGYSTSYSTERYIFHCENCKSNAEMEEKRKEREQRADWEERQKIKTKNYIENYLNPNNSFKSEISASEKINSIMEGFYSNRISDEVTDVILQMDYKDFLDTPYWDGVRNYKLKRAKYCCELCGAKGILHVHHKTYEHHGREHIKSIANKDLIVLCKNCHEKFHDKVI